MAYIWTVYHASLFWSSTPQTKSLSFAWMSYRLANKSHLDLTKLIRHFIRFVFGLCSVCVTSCVWSHTKLVLYLYLSSHYEPEYILYAVSICPVQLWLHSHTIISHKIILNYSWRLSLPCCLFFDGQLEAIGNTFRPSKHIQFRPYQAHVNVFDFVWHFI